jgi:hypothetical protein
MGHLFRFLRRLKHRFQVWRFKRRERHENHIIAQQQKQITAQAAAWDSDVATLQKQIREQSVGHEQHISGLASQIQVLEAENERWKEIWAREAERLAFEAARFERGKREYSEAPGKLVT